MSSLAVCSTGKSGPTLSIDAARLRAIAAVCPVAGQKVLPLDHAVGRVIAAPIMAAHALPPFDNSAMDGYALRLSDLTGEGPWHLPVSDRIAAGDARALTLAEGAAARVQLDEDLAQQLSEHGLQSHSAKWQAWKTSTLCSAGREPIDRLVFVSHPRPCSVLVSR